MSKFTRRKFVAGASAIPFALWLEGCNGNRVNNSGGGGDDPGGGGDETPDVPDAPDGLLVRYDARSAQGQAMLQIYRDAVASMQGIIQESDPSSWVFQWYIHGVKSSTTKAAEIARLYPNPSPTRDLAEAVWNTCQAHYPGDDENFFLPWHRMYVYYFETIIRAVSQEPSFTLPYWNYSTTNMADRGVIPTEFQQQGSSLFVGKRNPGVNDGDPIQGNDQALLDLDSLAQCTYKPAGAEQGFNMALDFGLHGNVHVLTGDRMNMGAVPWAAGDPIFWMHHCNIDRLWASWNAGGRQNPTDATWLDQTFTFADAAGQAVVAKVSDFNTTAQLGYEYDQLEPVPSCPSSEDAFVAPIETSVIATESAVSLAATPVRVRLGEGSTPAGLEAPDDRELYVVVKGLEAETQPGVVYNLYLNLPEGASGEAEEAHRVGSVNFFGAVGHGEGGSHGGGAAAAEVTEKFISFKITDLYRRLRAEGASASDLTIAPAGEPAGAANPVLGEVSLVRQ